MSDSQDSRTDVAVLRTEHLSRLVGSIPLVNDVSVSVIRGEIMAVCGPSGAGKSSFLRLINRLDEPTSGTCYLDGLDCRQLQPRELRRRIGLVLQTPFLFPGSVADNLRFGPSQRGETVTEAVVEHLLVQVGLSGFASRPVTELSGGEAQRVSVARTLANSPEVLLLDEPTSALDDVAKRTVEAVIVDVVRANQLTCLIVTHDTSQAARIADRAMLMRAGRLERIVAAQEITHA
jgi:ABC-type iron transport system FetAB ATPase subunit